MPAHKVVCHSPVFAPQVSKVLAPDEWLTLDEVRAALGPESALGDCAKFSVALAKAGAR